MKQLKHALTLVCCLVLLLSFFAVSAAANNLEPFDESRLCTLTVKVVWDSAPLRGMEFTVYHVGEVHGSAPTITLDAEFVKQSIDPANMDASAWDDLASTLLAYIPNTGKTPVYTGQTDANGLATTDQLVCGLYLVAGNTLETGDSIYSCKPFLVSLPGFSAGSWDYDNVAVPKLSVTTSQKTEISVHKIWDDWWDQSCRPSSIVVNLYGDGVLYDSATLSERTSWRYTWTGLNANKVWTVSEKPVSNYTVTITQNGTSFTISNRYDVPPPSGSPTPPTKLPQTGLLWWPVYAIAGVGVLLLLFGLVGMKLNRAQTVSGQGYNSWKDDEEE